MLQQLIEQFGASDLALYFLLPVVGAIGGHLWTRFRRRMATLRWTARYEPMAFATQDFGWGKVDILYQNEPSGNLHVITARVVNDSEMDLTAVELQFQMNEGTFVLRSMAQLSGAFDALPFTPTYTGILAKAGEGKLTTIDVEIWSRRSDFIAPVLNRGESIDARFLVSRTDHDTPAVLLHCSHSGVKVRHEPPAEQFLGVNQALAGWLGLLVGFGVVIAIVRVSWATWPGAITTWLAGALSILIGAGVVWAWRGLRRVAS